MTQLDQVHSFIKEAARRFVLPRFRNLTEGEIENKGPGAGMVTIADREAEAFLTEKLRELEPGSNVIGEEAVAANPSLLAHLNANEGVWIIDPVDGTGNFTRGNHNFCMMVAKVQSNRIVRSWIYMPLSGICLIAEAGAGAFLFSPEGKIHKRLQVENQKKVEECTGCLSLKHFPGHMRQKIKEETAVFHRSFLNSGRDSGQNSGSGRFWLGSAGCGYAALASGDLDYLFFSRLKVWDHVPGALLVREAGGECLLLNGEDYQPLAVEKNALLATGNPKIKSYLESVLRPLFKAHLHTYLE